MKRKLFSSPKSILVKRGGNKSRNTILASRGKTSKKGKGVNTIARPAYVPHVCEREDDCDVCRDYINAVQDYRDELFSKKRHGKRRQPRVSAGADAGSKGSKTVL